MRASSLALIAVFSGLVAAAACSGAPNHSTGSGGAGASDTTTTTSTGMGGAHTATTGSMGGLINLGGGGSTSSGCSGPTQCSADLHDVLDCNGALIKACPMGQGCSPSGTCVPACQAAEDSKSSVGCEYFALSAGGGICYASFIANTWDQPVSIQVDQMGAMLNVANMARIPSGSGQAITYSPLPGGQIPPGQVAILFLAGQCPGGVTPTGNYGQPFHITSSAPVVAYDIDPYGGGSSAVTGASLLIPTSAWDTNYIAVSPRPLGNNTLPPELSIIAKDDKTDVTILPNADIMMADIDGAAAPLGPKNMPITYSLNKGQQLHFYQQVDLTGSIVQATKPVGMVGRQGCINIGACCCDSAHQQIPPVQALGSEYVAIRYRNRVDGMEEFVPWRLVGAVDGTQLTYETQTPMGAPSTLNSGEVVEFNSPGAFVVKSQDKDHPFYLATFMTGAGDYMDRGDPEFVNVIPAGQYLSSYVFFTDPTYPETNLILIRKKVNGAFKDVNLDCAGVLSGWMPVGAKGDYEYTRTDLVRHNFAKQGNCDNGVHSIKSDNPFALTVWGWGSHDSDPFTSTYVSYAYPAGASIQPINTVVVVPVPK